MAVGPTSVPRSGMRGLRPHARSRLRGAGVPTNGQDSWRSLASNLLGVKIGSTPKCWKHGSSFHLGRSGASPLDLIDGHLVTRLSTISTNSCPPVEEETDSPCPLDDVIRTPVKIFLARGRDSCRIKGRPGKKQTPEDFDLPACRRRSQSLHRGTSRLAAARDATMQRRTLGGGSESFEEASKKAGSPG